MEVCFFIHGQPPTATAQTREVVVVNGKPKFFKPLKLRQAEQQLRDGLAPNRPEAPMEGPLRLTVKWVFRPPAGTRLNAEGFAWKTTRPDTDNLEKLLKDVMTSLGFWGDDSQVCSEIVEKFYGPHPGIWISIKTLNDN